MNFHPRLLIFEKGILGPTLPNLMHFDISFLQMCIWNFWRVFLNPSPSSDSNCTFSDAFWRGKEAGGLFRHTKEFFQRIFFRFEYSAGICGSAWEDARKFLLACRVSPFKFGEENARGLFFLPPFPPSATEISKEKEETPPRSILHSFPPFFQI